MNDELALKEALHDLTLDQPTAPVDRVTAVRRRHLRRRTTQLGAIAAVVLVAAVGAVVVRPFGDQRTTPVSRSVPSWALPWPDHRDGSVSQEVLDQAVSAWRHFHADQSVSLLPAPTKVIWYVGQRAVNNTEIVVVFEVDGVEGHRLVAGFAGAAGADGLSKGRFAPGSSPWVLYDVPAPAPSYDGIIGLNLSQSGPVDRNSFRNWIVVLTDPAARQIGWSGAGISSGAMTPDQGLAVADVGRPTGQVYAAVLHRTDQTGVSPQLPVGVPGNAKSRVPHLRPPAPLTGIPQGFPTIGPITAQGSSTGSELSFHRVGPTTIYARCYGATSMRVAIDTIRSAAGVVVPCDNRQHAVPGQPLRRNAPTKGHLVAVHADDFVAWTVAVVAG